MSKSMNHVLEQIEHFIKYDDCEKLLNGLFESLKWGELDMEWYEVLNLKILISFDMRLLSECSVWGGMDGFISLFLFFLNILQVCQPFGHEMLSQVRLHGINAHSVSLPARYLAGTNLHCSASRDTRALVAISQKEVVSGI